MADDEITIYKRGQPAVPGIEDNIGALLQFVALDDLQVALHTLSEQSKKKEFKGAVDSRTLDATERTQVLSLLVYWPFTPWISASFHNKGPDTVYFIFNYDDNWVDLDKDQSIDIDFSNADSRLGLIRYKCEPGKTATVKAKGKY